MMKIFIKLLCINLIILSFSCSRTDGVFAVKRFTDGSYRKVGSHFDIDSKEEVHWSVIFRKANKRRDLGIVVQAKGISWADVLNEVDYIDIDKPAIHGIFSDFPSGDYRIMIFDLKNNKIMLTQEFLVYEDEDEF